MGARRKTKNQLAHPQGGRPTRLMNDEIRKTLIDAIKLGVPIGIACQGAGIAEASYRNWLNRGVAEHEARSDDTYEPDPDETIYLEFYLAITNARTEAAIRNVGIIQKVATGGTVTEKTTETYIDSSGNEVTKETVKRQPPDWRAAAWYLERAHRSEYGKDAIAVEISGAPALPGEDGPKTPAEELAARLTAFVEDQELPDLPALSGPSSTTDDDTVDAEIVEEPAF